MAIEISQKCQYALRAVFDLAKWREEGPRKISEIAKAQAIPPRFLENILNELKRHGIVDSRRGKTGGYVLTADPNELSVGEVMELIQGPIAVVECDGGTPKQKCPFEQDCVFWPMWRKAQDALRNVYYGTTFSDMVLEETKRQKKDALMYTI